VTDVGGRRAALNGHRLQEAINRQLILLGYRPNRAASLAEFKSSRETLYPTAGQFAEQCKVPLVAPYHRGRNRFATVDFLNLTGANEFVILSLKSQSSQGTADQKLEYEVQQLIATELPAAMLVYGDGWHPEVLHEIWERAQHYGSSRVLLFRRIERLTAWMQAGMQVAGHGATSADIFAHYCDREP